MDDEVVGVVHQFGDEGGGQGAIEPEGVPVLFVHVVAGNDGVVFVAEFDGAIGIALEIHAAFVVIEGEGGEHFAEDFINEDVRAERCFFGDAGFGEHVAAAVIDGEGHSGVFLKRGHESRSALVMMAEGFTFFGDASRCDPF